MSMIRQRLSILTLAGLATLTLISQAEAAPLEVERNTVLKHFQADSDKFIGQRFVFNCPAANVRTVDAALVGSDVYPSDSPLCVAATHAGAIDDAGGVIVVQLNPGQDAYVGSDRHGIESASFPGTARSIVFIDPTRAGQLDAVSEAYAPVLTWDTKFTATGLANRNLVGQRFLFKCPAASGALTARRVYGTDRYAFNSFVCQAAVHAGQITHAGGFVRLQLDEGVQKLQGSIRHGIESKDGPGGSRTISFVTGPTAQQVTHAGP